MKMIKGAILLILILVGSKQVITSQIWEISTGLQSVNTDGVYLTRNTFEQVEFENKGLLYIASFGANIPIYKIKNELVLGSQANIYINALCSGGAEGHSPSPEYGFGIPVYATLRYGGGSRKGSDKIFGFGVGFGYKINGFLADLATENEEDGGTYFFGRSMFMAEISFDRSHKVVLFDNFKFRFEIPFKTYHIEYELSNHKYFYNFNQASFTIVLCF